MRHILAFAVAGAALLPTRAHAQYKNNAFGFDAGYWLITKPSVVDGNGDILATDDRPVRVSNGLRLGGETNFKMDQDHWWFIARLNLGFLSFAPSDSETGVQKDFDEAAKAALGTMLGVEGNINIRYYAFTDRVRPYLQAGVGFLRLFTFSGAAEDTCDIPDVCPDGDTNEAEFLPHPNVGTFHVQPGIEFILTRDIALHVNADLAYWLIFNTADNKAVTFSGGVLFYL